MLVPPNYFDFMWEGDFSIFFTYPRFILIELTIMYNKTVLNLSKIYTKYS